VYERPTIMIGRLLAEFTLARLILAGFSVVGLPVAGLPVVVFSVVSLSVLAPTASAQVLRYGGAPGTTRTYVREQRDHVVQTVDGRPTVTDIQSYWRLRTRVAAETTDDLTIGIVHDSLAITRAPSIGDLGIEALGRTPIEIVLTRRGAVRELEVPAELTPLTSRLDLETTYRSFFPRLPETAAVDGLVWSDTTRVATRQNGLDLQVVRVNRYTSKGWAISGENRVIRVAYESDLTIEGSGQQQEAAVALSGSGLATGAFDFDPRAGVYVGGGESSTMKMVAIVTSQGQNLVIPIEQNRTETITSEPSR
jgi:hypothetical protein